VKQAKLVAASLIHVGPLALHMRDSDRRECAALGRTPKQGLRLSLRTSFEAVTALDPDGRPLAMFGVAPIRSASLAASSLEDRDSIVDQHSESTSSTPSPSTSK
jgi:hypothetical protein